MVIVSALGAGDYEFKSHLSEIFKYCLDSSVGRALD